MFRPASRSVLRAAQSSLAPARTIAGRRFISTEPPHLRSRSWKSSAARWGIAIAGLYYYNTSPVFAEQPSNNLLNPNTDALEDNDHSTLETLTSRRKRQDQKNTSVLESALQTTSEENASQSHMSVSADHDQLPVVGSPADLEEEAGQQGAFNEETGEINWDCPCLGGMAHGPCGPQFREAFSCFVFSKEEPKGMDCIEKFKGMQDCFQEHPEIYKGELEDDEEFDEEARLELQKEIAARQEAAGNQEKDGDIAETAPRRLLEEAGPVSEKAKTEAEGKAKAGEKPLDISSTQPPQRKAKVQASSEPLPGMSEEHENLYESQSSPALRKPNPPPVVDKFDEDLELMPKSWHDARGSEEKKPESS